MINQRFIIAIVYCLLAISLVSSATLYVQNPSLCPQSDSINFAGQSCTGSNIICGDNSGLINCISPIQSAPSSTTVSGNYGGLSPGFGVNCYATISGSQTCADSGKAVCQQDSTCQNSGRLTQCTDWGVASCSTCRSGWQDCDGDGTGSDGGCEIQTGVATRGTNVVYGASCGYQCSSGYLDCNGDGTGSDGGCEVAVGSSCTTVEGGPGTIASCGVCNAISQPHLIANTEASAFGNFLVWAEQLNPVGWLMKLTNSNNDSIGIDNDACIVFKDGSKMCGAGNITMPGQNESGALIDNSTIDDRIGQYNSSIPYVDNNFLRKDGDNATGRYDFNGGWDNDGITFDLGDIFAQRLFVFNITSLAISHLNVNGSLLPDFDNFFDLGSSLFRWRNGYFAGDVRVDGDVYFGNETVTSLISSSEARSNNYTNIQFTSLNSSLRTYVDNSVSLGSGVGTIVGMTTATTSGNAISGSYIGYAAMNDICNSEFAGSHLCSTGEVLATISSGNYSYSGYPWLANGPPGYTSNSNDCNGWTDGTSDYLGPFWNWELNAQAGAAFLTPCSQIKSLMCCR